MVNPNQNLNTPRTVAGFQQLLNSLGPGGRAATDNFLALAVMSGGRVDPSSVANYRASFPLISAEVFSRVADGTAGLNIPREAGAVWARGDVYVPASVTIQAAAQLAQNAAAPVPSIFTPAPMLEIPEPKQAGAENPSEALPATPSALAPAAPSPIMGVVSVAAILAAVLA